LVQGLSTTPKSISPKWFYDAEGSRLFEDITRLPEYYPTRQEAALLRRLAPAFAQAFGPDATLIEFGSGASEKTRILLDAGHDGEPQRKGGERLARGAWGGTPSYVCHATPANPLSGVLQAAPASEAALRAQFADLPADVIVLGHTHMPALRRLGRQLIINPGSLGQPRSGLPDATYAVWQDGKVQIRHLHYDHEAVERKLRLAALSPAVRERLAHLLHTGLPEPDLFGSVR